MDGPLKTSLKKKEAALKNGAEQVGFFVKRNSRVRNLSESEFRDLMQHPD